MSRMKLEITLKSGKTWLLIVTKDQAESVGVYWNAFVNGQEIDGRKILEITIDYFNTRNDIGGIFSGLYSDVSSINTWPTHDRAYTKKGGVVS